VRAVRTCRMCLRGPNGISVSVPAASSVADVARGLLTWQSPERMTWHELASTGEPTGAGRRRRAGRGTAAPPSLWPPLRR